MNLVRKAASAWKKDQVLGRVVRNSGYLFASNVITALLSIFTANLLGVERFGALSIVMAAGIQRQPPAQFSDGRSGRALHG